MTPNNAAALAAAVTKQPVSVLLDAESSVFQSYKSGIIDDPNCGTVLDHAGLLIGYGDGYWLLKISWGTGWGEGGYFKVAKKSAYDNSAGMCGVQSQGVIALL